MGKGSDRTYRDGIREWVDQMMGDDPSRLEQAAAYLRRTSVSRESDNQD